MQAQVLDDGSWRWRDPQTRLTWVFGMRWFPSLGNKGRRHLYRNLRQQGFGWAVTHGKSLSLVGVPSKQTAAKPMRQTLSAAAAFACVHPQGVHALCLEVSGVGVWFVASSQGCVLSETDRWFDSLDQAQLALQPLRERHDPMTYEHVVWCVAIDAVSEAKSLDTAGAPKADSLGMVADTKETDTKEAVTTASKAPVPAFLRGGAHKDCQFRKLPAAQSAWPLFLAFGCLGAAALLVVHRLWLVPSLPPVSSQPFSPAPIKPAPVKVHHPDGLDDIFTAWQDLPVDPAGWLLKGVRCPVDTQIVRCIATYERQQPDADNAGLARHTPPHWQFVPDSLDQAQLRRDLSLPLGNKSVSFLMSTAEGLTRMQQVSAELASASVGAPRQISVQTQRQAAGTSHPSRVSGDQAPVWIKRAVAMRLALRQRAKLLALGLPVRWQQIDLLLVQGAQIDKRHGYLMVSLQGDWMVQPHQSGTQVSEPVSGHVVDNEGNEHRQIRQATRASTRASIMTQTNPQTDPQTNQQTHKQDPWRQTPTTDIEGEIYAY
jgi:hypothetical protein